MNFSRHNIQRCLLVSIAIMCSLMPSLKAMEKALPSLQQAARANMMPELLTLLQQGVDVNGQDPKSYTALHWAANNGHYKVVAQLLAFDADVHATTRDGETALQLAIDSGHESTASLLRGLTLMPASQEQEIVPVKMALSVESKRTSKSPRPAQPPKQEVNTKYSEGKPALHQAAENNDLNEIRGLIKSGADVNVRNDRGGTPLHAAALNGHTEASTYLLDRGAKINAVNQYGNTALHVAALKGHTETGLMLVAKGIDADVRNANGQTALEIAQQSQKFDLFMTVSQAMNKEIPETKGTTPKAPKAKNAESVLTGTATQAKTGKKKNKNSSADFDNSKSQSESYSEESAERKPLKLKVTATKNDQINMKDSKGWAPLHRAVKKDLLEKVEELIVSGADVNLPGKKKQTPLHRAIYSGNPQLIEVLLVNGANSNAQDKDQSTPLHLAALYNSFSTVIIEKLITHTGDVHARDSLGKTPLHLAAAYGHTDIVLFLLEHGADKNIKDTENKTPLQLASERGHTEVIVLLRNPNGNADDALHLAAAKGLGSAIERLVKAGYDVNSRDNRGNVPLHLAEDKDIAKFLIKHGSDVNARDSAGATPLLNAVWKEKYDLAGYLVESGADVNAVTQDGMTCLLCIASRTKDVKNASFVEALIARGADMNAKHKDGDSALHKALFFDCRIKYIFIATLLTNGADVTVKNAAGMTPFHRFVTIGHGDQVQGIAEAFIANGANVNEKDADGNSLLHLAVQRAQTELVAVLLAHGADISAKGKFGFTPLALAQSASFGKTEWYKDIIALLTEGAKKADDNNVDKGDNKGRTALHRAAKKGTRDEVIQLIRRGADVNAKSKNGGTPLSSAMLGNHYEICSYLIEKKADVSDPMYLEMAVSGEKHVALLKDLIALGADVNAENQDGITPLEEACNWLVSDKIKTLIGNGANVKKQFKNGDTLLHRAVTPNLSSRGQQANLSELISWLIDAAVDPNSRASDNSTPLHRAVESCNQDLINCLLDKGADVNVQDNKGITPLHLAASIVVIPEWVAGDWQKSYPTSRYCLR